MDPISNMLISIKNAQSVKKEIVEIPASKLKLEIAKTLKKEGFIEDYEVVKGKNDQIKIKLRYKGRNPAITEIQRVSKPGCKIYVKNKEIPVVLRGLGIVIISTPVGVMTGKDAKKKGLGGEVILKVW